MTTPIPIGTTTQTGELIVLTPEARHQHVYVVGVSGTGKSTLLERIVCSDMESGDGLCVLDPHGSLIDALLPRVPEHRLDEVILWDPLDAERPFGLNLFACDVPTNPLQRDRVASTFIGTFQRIFPEAFASGPRMEELMRNLAISCIENPGLTLAEAPRFLSDEPYRARFLGNISNPYIREEYWPRFSLRTLREQNEIISSSLNKIGRFLGNTLMRNIFGQPDNSVNFLNIMNERRLLFVRLPVGELGAENAELLGSIIVGSILDAALMRRADPTLPQFHLVVDEFQRFVSSAFPTLLAEARKYRIDAVIAHQWRDQLDGDNQGATLSVRNKIIFKVNAEDAKELAGEFDTTPGPSEMRTEMIMEPLVHRWSSTVWDPPEAETVYNRMGEELEDVLFVAHIFTALFGFNQGEYLSLLPDARKRKLDSTLRRLCVFDFGDDRVRAFATARVREVLGESFRPVKEKVPPVSFPFPLDLPMVLDKVLERRLEPAAPDDPTTALIRARLEPLNRELEARLAAWKRTATCAFHPTGFRPVFAPYTSSHWTFSDPPDLSAWLDEVVPRLDQKAIERRERLLRQRSKILASCLRNVEHERDLGIEVPARRPDGVASLGDGILRLVDEHYYRRVPGPLRLRSDVEAEIANQLANLDNFRARCRLVQGRASQEVTIDTLGALEKVAQTTIAEVIRERSRFLYGRDRAEVEQAIARRLIVPDPNPSHDDHDNDILIFGERQTATTETGRRRPASDASADGA